MRALVTGADGLLGSHLVRGLLQRGLRVRALVHPTSKSPTLDGLEIEIHKADLCSPLSALAPLAEGCDCAFHCAAITDIKADPKLVWDVNLEGTRKLLDAALAAKLKRLICVGSASSFQFGTKQHPGDETCAFPEQYRGVAYMESKHAAMQLVRQYVEQHKLNALIVAPTFMLGKFDFRPSSGELIRQFIRKQLPAVPPGGRNFVCAQDVAAALVAALDKGEAGQTYIAGGANLSYLEFFTQVAQIAGIKAPKFVLPQAAVLAAGLAGSAFGRISGKRPQLDYRMARLALCSTYYSPRKAIEQLGMPQTPVEQGIRETIDDLRKYGHIR